MGSDRRDAKAAFYLAGVRRLGGFPEDERFASFGLALGDNRFVYYRILVRSFFGGEHRITSDCSE